MTLVFPCDNFIAPTRGVAPYRACADCGFCEIIHGLTAEELLARGLWDFRRFTPGMEDTPQRQSWLELERGLTECDLTANQVLKAINNAPSL